MGASHVVGIATAVALIMPGSAHAQQSFRDTTQRRVTADFAYSADAISNVDGGLRRGTAVAGAVEAQITLHLAPLVRWPGASFLFAVIGTHGGAPSALVGDVQGVSNLEDPPVLRLDQLWLQQSLRANRVLLLLGRYDLNSEFYRLQSGDLFLNSSLELGPEFGLSGVAGPSISPNTAIGGRLAVRLVPNGIWRTAILDGVPVNRPDGGVHPFAPGDGLVIVSEISFLARPDTSGAPRRRRFLIVRGGTRPYTAKVALGGWYYPGRFPDLSDTLASGEPVQRHGSAGAYLIADQTIWSAMHAPSRALSVFAQLGVGDNRVNEVGGYVGGGLSLLAPFVKRPKDELGIAVAAARIGSHLDRAREPLGDMPDGETTIELTYQAQFGSGFALQPDVQYVIHPSATRTTRNALVLGVRVELSR